MGLRVQREAMTLAAGHDTLGTSAVDAVEEAVLAMPESSFAPLLTATGLGLLFGGLLTGVVPLTAVAGVVTVGGILAWVRLKPQPAAAVAAEAP
jgi:hypothetical protein